VCAYIGNTRVIGQKELQSFREKLGDAVNDPYQVLLRRNKLPMGLLQDVKSVCRLMINDISMFILTYLHSIRRHAFMC
jgi:nuclear GTP-binding protein